VARDGSALPAFSGGAHTVVEMDDHGTRRLNPYSLMSDPEDRSAMRSACGATIRAGAGRFSCTGM
jgi:ferredoxin-NADP reductase